MNQRKHQEVPQGKIFAVPSCLADRMQLLNMNSTSQVFLFTTCMIHEGLSVNNSQRN